MKTVGDTKNYLPPISFRPSHLRLLVIRHLMSSSLQDFNHGKIKTSHLPTMVSHLRFIKFCLVQTQISRCEKSFDSI